MQIQLSHLSEFTGLRVDGNKGRLELSLPDLTGVEIIAAACLIAVSKSLSFVQDSRRVCIYIPSLFSVIY